MYSYIFRAFIIFISTLFLNLLCVSYASISPGMLNQSYPSLSPILKNIIPAVVNISTIPVSSLDEDEDADLKDSSQNSPYENHEPHELSKRLSRMGSGVIVDPDQGYILTNAHIVYKSKSVRVVLQDERIAQARVVGIDRASDIAVLQIQEKNLKAIPLGDSEQLNVGDFVLAIGNPFGLNQTVTSGIISALQRNNLHIVGSHSYENFIQTDAPINPGNSGGALVNLKGQLIGINTAILGNHGSNIGIGFAIPINMAIHVMHQLIEHGSVSRGYLGVISQSIFPTLNKPLDIKTNEGAIVTYVTHPSPAEEAGLKVGDVIVSINGKPVYNPAHLRNMLSLMPIGKSLNMEILRNGKKLKIITYVVEHEKQEKNSLKESPFIYGLSFKNFEQHIPLLGHVFGVLITGVQENTPGEKAHLEPGDVILSAGGKDIHSIEELQERIKQNKTNQLIIRVLKKNGVNFEVLWRE